ncbi:MAG: hypothetical protein JST22_20995, partial [Bacteroidetes bacterium]|nr:hypothetical protein [Bacteroidota bacterium]
MKPLSYLPVWVMLLAAIGPRALAQGGTITADPNAKPLRPIWHMALPSYYSASLDDLFGTGHGAWATLGTGTVGWQVFRYDGGLLADDTIPVWNPPAWSSFEATGRFWGSGHSGLPIPPRSDMIPQMGTRCLVTGQGKRIMR